MVKVRYLGKWREVLQGCDLEFEFTSLCKFAEACSEADEIGTSYIGRSLHQFFAKKRYNLPIYTLPGILRQFPQVPSNLAIGNIN